jgi:carbon storage regulator CsrA
MLVLNRKIGQRIIINDNIIITFCGMDKYGRDKVRLGIEAPPGVNIARAELLGGIDYPCGQTGVHGSTIKTSTGQSQ